MMCYKDMTFCVSKNCINACGSKLTDEIIAAAEIWWGSPNPPICTGCLCDE